MSVPEGGVARLHLTCRGVVQGVGARPTLQRLASRMDLRGSLRNSLEGLDIDLCGARMALEDFLNVLPAALPAAARLEGVEVRWLEPPALPWPQEVVMAADSAVSLASSLVAPGLSADRAPCARCREELVEPSSRRHRYPFISCCDCGPRFSLATALPFCRAHTTLAAFPPCPACAKEFRDRTNRRFHAETISCPACGPRLRLLDSAGASGAEGDGALLLAQRTLLEGGILALQGVGGFQLLVDATQRQAVQRLRQRKHRPAKPFAILVAHLRDLKDQVWISPAEKRALQGPAAPIVLLRRRFSTIPDPWDAVAPGSDALGVMLPASPLHHLLAGLVGCPLVATSGNRSGEPLCLSQEEALDRLGGVADAFLVHDLPLARPLDDSLLQVIEGQPSLLRRARGFAPEPLPWRGPAHTSPSSQSAGALLALGGDLKASPALVMGGHLWLAPHLGDLADGGVQRFWQRAVEAQLQSPALPVGALACDAHPGYVSHQLLRPLAERHRLPLNTVPHHLAHGLAVLAESGRQPPLLVVACDGLGYGDLASERGSERLWGGELLFIPALNGEGLRWERLAALRPFPLPGGERASREPRRCALGLLTAAGSWAMAHPGALRSLEAFPSLERHLLVQAIEADCNAPPTSSLGRFLDGVVSLLGLAQSLSYEGEGGLRWQEAASRWRHQRRLPQRTDRSYSLESAQRPWPFPLSPLPPDHPSCLPLGRWDWEPLLQALLVDRASGGDPSHGAWQVQRALVEGIVEGISLASTWSGCSQVALTGGCFQNRSLLEGCVRGLRRAGLEPLWAQKAPCNDGGLALGQAWAVQACGADL